MAAPVRDNRSPQETGRRPDPVPPGRRRPARARSWTTALTFGPPGVDIVAMAIATAAATRDLECVAPTAALAVLLNIAAGLYRPRLLPSILDGLLRLTLCGLVAGMTAASVVRGVYGTEWIHDVAPTALLYTFLACCGRAVFHATLRGARRRGGTRSTIMIGAGYHGHRLAAALLDHPEYGLWPAGFVDDPRESMSQDVRIPFLGGPDQLGAILRAHRVRAVIIALPYGTGQETRLLARISRGLGCEVYFAPEPGDILVDFVPLGENVRSFPVLRMRPPPQARLTWPLKRALDIALAVVGLAVAMPIMAVCALAVRWEGGPGVLFRQHRVGLRGRRITLLKLRTIKPVSEQEADTRWSVADDLRLGSTGKVLRKTSLDELPQLWNVLRGDMSLVGPRPERPYFVEKFAKSTPSYELRHRVPVGITGWAQIHGLRGDTSIEDRARFDNHYIDNWSLGADVKILVRTVWCVLRSRGA